jgi:hypothetical protein
MLGDPMPATLPTRLVVAVDAFGFADVGTAAALQPLVQALAAAMKDVRDHVERGATVDAPADEVPARPQGQCAGASRSRRAARV